MLISPANAQDAAAPGGFDPVFLIMMVAMFAVFWFLVIRPQQKRAKEHQNMLKAIKRGDQYVAGELFLLALTDNKGDIGKLVRENGLTRKALEAAIEAVRGEVEELARSFPLYQADSA